MHRRLFYWHDIGGHDMLPNKSQEPTAVGAGRSAVAVHVMSRLWLSFLRYAPLHTPPNMNTQTSAPTPAIPSGIGLLVLGLLSLLFGPFTAVQGLILSKRFRPFTTTASVGYFLCWLFLVLSVFYVLLFVLFIFHRKA